MEDEPDTDDEDIEAQIQRELEGLQPNKDKPRQFRPVQLEMPCGTPSHSENALSLMRLTAPNAPMSQSGKWLIFWQLRLCAWIPQ